MPDVPLLDRAANALGEDSRAARVRVGQQHGELLAAIARDDVAGAADAVVDDGGDLLERVVAGLVTERVVVGLEAVDVGHQQREARLGAHRPPPLHLQFFFERSTVGDVGDRVHVRHQRQLPVRILELFAALADQAHQVRLQVAQHPQPPAVEAEEHERCSADTDGHQPDRDLHVEERPHQGAGLSSAAGPTAASAAENPILECVPSQNGLVVEPPQRQSANGPALDGILPPLPVDDRDVVTLDQVRPVTADPDCRHGVSVHQPAFDGRRQPIFCIDARKSALVFVFPSLSSSSSIASTGDSGLSTLRSTQIAAEILLRHQQLFLARAALRDVDRREDPLVRQLPVEVDLHVAGALELLEDHVVHAGAGVDERRRDDGERPALLDVPRRAEEALWLLQRV